MEFKEIYSSVYKEVKGFPQWIDFCNEVQRDRNMKNLKTQLKRYGFDWRLTDELYNKIFTN